MARPRRDAAERIYDLLFYPGPLQKPARRMSGFTKSQIISAIRFYTRRAALRPTAKRGKRKKAGRRVK